MNYKQSYLIAVGMIGLCMSTPIVSQAAPKPLNSTIASVSSPSSQAAELTRRISIIEVERTLLLAQSKPETSQIENLNRQNITLMAQLKQLEPVRYQALASSAMQKALAGKIGELDVERAIALSRLKIDNPVIQAIDMQRLLLSARLKQLQPNRYQALAFSATRSALQAKIAELQALYQQEDRRLIPSAPSQQILKAQIDGLNQRLAEVPKN